MKIKTFNVTSANLNSDTHVESVLETAAKNISELEDLPLIIRLNETYGDMEKEMAPVKYFGVGPKRMKKVKKFQRRIGAHFMYTEARGLDDMIDDIKIVSKATGLDFTQQKTYQGNIDIEHFTENWTFRPVDERRDQIEFNCYVSLHCVPNIDELKELAKISDEVYAAKHHKDGYILNHPINGEIKRSEPTTYVKRQMHNVDANGMQDFIVQVLKTDVKLGMSNRWYQEKGYENFWQDKKPRSDKTYFADIDSGEIECQSICPGYQGRFTPQVEISIKVPGRNGSFFMRYEAKAFTEIGL